MDQNTEIVATCEAAVTRLTEKGHIQGRYANNDGSACLVGAIALSQVGVERWADIDNNIDKALECPAIVAVAETIVEKTNSSPWFAHSTRAAGTVISYNDDPDRTVDDVIDVLNETIKRHTDEKVA